MNTSNCSLRWSIATVATLCLSAGLVSGASVKVAAPTDATGAAGATVSLPLYIRGAQGMGSLQLELTYAPEVLEAKGAAASAAMPAVLLEHNVLAPGRVRIALAGNESINGDAQIDLTFLVKSAGTSDLRLENARAWDLAGGLDMLVATEDGRFASRSAGGGMFLWIAVASGAGVLVLVVVLLARRKRPA